MKDKECKQYIHTYKCGRKSCDGCKNRYGRRNENMTGRELSDKLNYIGMGRRIRQLALDSKLATAEEMAVMSEIEVCDLIMKNYTVVYAEAEEIGLVPKDKMDEYNKLVKCISR